MSFKSRFLVWSVLVVPLWLGAQARAVSPRWQGSSATHVREPLEAFRSLFSKQDQLRARRLALIQSGMHDEAQRNLLDRELNEIRNSLSLVVDGLGNPLIAEEKLAGAHVQVIEFLKGSYPEDLTSTPLRYLLYRLHATRRLGDPIEFVRTLVMSPYLPPAFKLRLLTDLLAY